MQRRRFEVDLLPAEINHFRRPQAMPIREEDRQGITIAVAITFSCIDQLPHFIRSEVFARSQGRVGRPARDCSIFSCWRY
jgi:hypothetical protein